MNQEQRLTVLGQTWVIFVIDLLASIPDLLVRCVADLPVGVCTPFWHGELLCICQKLDFIGLRHPRVVFPVQVSMEINASGLLNDA